MPLPSSDEDWLASALRASARAADGNAKLLRVFSWQAFECSRLGTAAASRTVGPIAELDVLLALPDSALHSLAHNDTFVGLVAPTTIPPLPACQHLKYTYSSRGVPDYDIPGKPVQGIINFVKLSSFVIYSNLVSFQYLQPVLK